MLEVYSAESEESNWASKEKALKQNGSLRIMNTVKQSSERTSQESKSMVTSKKSILENLNQLTSSQADSHARTSHTQTQEEKASQDKEVGCGHITQKLLGRYDLGTRSLKTFQHLLTKDSILSLETLPKRGMMRNGLLYELRISERYTEESDCSLLPTPQAREWKGMTGADYKIIKEEKSEWGRGGLKGALLPTLTNSGGTEYMRGNPTMKGALLPTLTTCGNYNYKGASDISGDGIITVLKNALLPTIGANEYKGSAKSRYKGSKDSHGAKMSEGLRTCQEDPAYLNPSFAEVVMGFPVGWTEISAAEMQLYRKSRSSSHGESRK